MKIGIDMDDTIEELCKAWVKWINEKYNLNVDLNDSDHWSNADLFPMLTLEQINEPLAIEEFWDTVKPREDALRIIPQLAKSHELFLITNSSYKSLIYKIPKVLNKYFPEFDRDHIIICAKKQMIDVDVMIDDYEGNLLGGKFKKILINQPWNRYANNEDLIRVNSWDEIEELIDKEWK